MRRVILSNDQVYHIFNRGVEKREIFTDIRTCERGVLTLDYYRFKKPTLRLSQALLLRFELREAYFEKLHNSNGKHVEFIAYCLMPNHFHFLLRQKIDGGITKFMKNFTDSYCRYFNTKYKRKGPLMEGVFKSVFVETDEELMHISRYIHLNPVVANLVTAEDLEGYKWSSFPEYLGLVEDTICDTETTLNNFKSKQSYRKFVYDQIDYSKKLKEIRHIMME